MRPGDRPVSNITAAGPPDKVTEPAGHDPAGQHEDSDPDGPAAEVPPITAGQEAEFDGSGPERADPAESTTELAATEPDPAGSTSRSTGSRSKSASWATAARLRALSSKAVRPTAKAAWPKALVAVSATRRLLRGAQARLGRPGFAAAGFARLTVVPAILVAAWLLPGLPLLLAGSFLPVPMLLISAPLAVALAVFCLRRVPVSWPRVLPSPARERGWAAWFGLAGTAVVAAGFAAWQLRYNSESIIVLRGPGAYLQTGYWIAQHGSLPIPQSLAAFGGAHTGLGFSSTGFFARGTSLVPGVMSGLPMLLAGAFWTAGSSAAVALGPVLGGLAVLAFGGLVGRLTAPQWAPAGALVLGFTLPEQYTSRSSFSETAAQVLLFGALCLIIDSLTLAAAAGLPAARPAAPRGWRRWLAPQSWATWYTPQRAMAALGGLALGLTAVVQFDGLLDALPAIVFAGILIAGRRATALTFSAGLVVGAGYGLADGYLLARPFMASLRPAPEEIGLAAAVLAAVTLAVVELCRHQRLRGGLRKVLRRKPLRSLPAAGALVAVAVLIGLAVRPYLQTVRGQANHAIFDYVASLQRLQQLRLDPGRTYAEDTLYWVIWYIGVPAVLLGGFGLALLVRRCLRALITWKDPAGAHRNWALPLALICWGSAAALWRPDITPDQPWASRRLVPLVLPGLIICAIWASAWLVGRGRERGAGAVASSFVGACCVAALLVPTAVTTFGLGLAHTGKGGGLRPSANGQALRRTGQGEVSAVRRLCASIRPGSSVVIIDRLVAERFTQVIRGMCNVPVGWMTGQPVAAVDGVISSIVTAGRTPVLLAARPGQLAAYGVSRVKILDLVTTQDPHSLTQPPAAPGPVHYVIWLAVPGAPGIGA